MPFESTSHSALQRVFREGFSVRDIASPLISFDESTDYSHIQQVIAERRIEVVGVRRDGQIVGYVSGNKQVEGPCGQASTSFANDEVIDEHLPLNDVVIGLNEKPRLFVRCLGSVAGIATRSDLQKPPVRMWLFGMITLIEMRFSVMIHEFLPNDGWTEFISEGRLKKAQDLLEERTRRNQELHLIDCLQFSDKGQVLARCEKLRSLTRFQSRSKLEQVVKKLEAFRNNLAHAQDIITNDWNVIVQLAENLERVVDGPEAWREARRAASEEKNRSDE